MTRTFTEIVCAQGSPEWFQARVARVTGTAAKDVVATVKAGEAAARRDLRVRLLVERLTGLPEDTGNGFVNDAMRWGIEHEDEAIAQYEALTGLVVHRSGFLAHNDLMCGVSLDGYVGDVDGCVETKSPKSATHLGYLRGDPVVPPEHIYQCRHALFVTGAQWCDFLSYDCRFPTRMQTFLVRLTREQAELDAYEQKLRAFLNECDREYAAVLGWHVIGKAEVTAHV